MKLVADDVQSVIIPGSGHWVAEGRGAHARVCRRLYAGGGRHLLSRLCEGDERRGEGTRLVAYKDEGSVPTVPTALTVFPGEIYRAPRTWVERTYPNLIYFHEVDKGGHFAAWEQPQLSSGEVRAAFRSLR